MKHYSYFIIYLLLNRLATSVATPVSQHQCRKTVSNSLKGKTVRDPLVGSRIVRGTCGGGALIPNGIAAAKR